MTPRLVGSYSPQHDRHCVAGTCKWCEEQESETHTKEPC